MRVRVARTQLLSMPRRVLGFTRHWRITQGEHNPLHHFIVHRRHRFHRRDVLQWIYEATRIMALSSPSCDPFHVTIYCSTSKPLLRQRQRNRHAHNNTSRCSSQLPCRRWRAHSGAPRQPSAPRTTLTRAPGANSPTPGGKPAIGRNAANTRPKRNTPSSAWHKGTPPSRV